MITFRKGHCHVAFLTTSDEVGSGYTKKRRNVVTKTWRVMKLTAALLVGICLQAAAAGHAQRITYEAKKVTLNEVLTEVKKQTGFDFIIDKAIKNREVSSVNVNDMQVEEFLSSILSPFNLDFSIQYETIFVRPKPESPRPFLPILDNPPITVRGKIVNEKGEPVVASILVKGTNRGTTSDGNGEFELTNVDPEAVLIISATNIESIIINVNGHTSLSVTAKNISSALEEVVINKGYYTTTEKLNTGTVGRVTAKDIERQPVTNPLMALQGRVAGVDIVPQSGIAGTAVDMSIRGKSSLTTIANNPLYVIDGVPVDSRIIQSQSETFNTIADFTLAGYNPLSTINPANIESIEILKDADATAIYGSRGANGVILITTKTGKNRGPVSVQLDAYTGIGKVGYFPKMLNTQQYLQMRKEAYINAGTTPSGSQARDLLVYDQNKYTDWSKTLVGGTANNTNVQANISWGNETTTFRFGGAYQKETTIYTGDFGFENGSGNFSMNHLSADKKFSAQFNANYGSLRNNFFNSSNFASLGLTLQPNAPDLYTANGELNFFPDAFGTTQFFNPLINLYKTTNVKTSSLNTNARFGYQINRLFKVGINLGYNDLHSDETILVPIISNAPEARPFSTGYATFSNTNRKSWLIEPRIEYAQTFNTHKFDAFIGATIQQSLADNKVAQAEGYSSDALLGTLSGSPAIRYLTDNNSIYKYTALFARIGYSYQDKYLLNLTGRRDGSSRFAPENQFGTFGAVGAAWIFSNEYFIKEHLPFISFGKLRGSYGITGNDQIGDYSYFDTYRPANVTYQNTVVLQPQSLYNPNFGWEATTKLEGGLQLGFFNDKVSLEVDWYRHRSSNQLINYAIPATTGFQSFAAYNFPATVQNSGWEFLLNLNLFSARQFTWNSSFNLTLPRNKLVAFPEIEKTFYSYQYVVGQPLSVKPMYIFTGIDNATGAYTFKDVDDDGIITPSDQVLMDRGRRKLFGGVNNSFQYKGFDLSFLFQFVDQEVISRTLGAPGRAGNQFVDLLDRWQKPGDEGKYAKVTSQGSNQSLANASDWAASDGSFIRLKTAQIGWAMPDRWSRKCGFKKIKFFVQGQNLVTFTKFKRGYDPETLAQLPPLRVFTFGLSAGL